MPEQVDVAAGRYVLPTLTVIPEDPVPGADINEVIIALDYRIEMIYICVCAGKTSLNER